MMESWGVMCLESNKGGVLGRQMEFGAISRGEREVKGLQGIIC